MTPCLIYTIILTKGICFGERQLISWLLATGQSNDGASWLGAYPPGPCLKRLEFLIVSLSHFLFLYFLPQLKRIIEELAKEI